MQITKIYYEKSVMKINYYTVIGARMQVCNQSKVIRYGYFKKQRVILYMWAWGAGSYF